VARGRQAFFIDQRTEAIRQLSGLVDVSVIQTESGIALTTSNGTPLVSGQQSYQLTTQGRRCRDS